MPRGNMTPKKMMAMEAKEHGMKMKKASGRGPAMGGYDEAKPSMKKPAKKRMDNMGDTKPYKRPMKMVDEAPMKGKKGGGLMIAIAIGKPKKKGKM
jgi:hypothetical protein